MNFVIYLNDDNQLQGYMNLNIVEFKQILDSVEQSKIIYFNGHYHEENYPQMFESDKATFVSLIKAIKRPWEARRIMVQPKQEIKDTPKPKKRGRKKKA